MCSSWKSLIRSERSSRELPKSRKYSRSSACRRKPLRPALAGSTSVVPLPGQMSLAEHQQALNRGARSLSESPTTPCQVLARRCQ